MNGRWKFKTDPDGMGDVSPDVVRNTIGATQQECKFFAPEFDDRHWGEITVPACWQAEGHRYNGVAWYRTRFDYRAGRSAVVRLHFQGVDYFADAWINGYYLGRGSAGVRQRIPGDRASRRLIRRPVPLTHGVARAAPSSAIQRFQFSSSGSRKPQLARWTN